MIKYNKSLTYSQRNKKLNLKLKKELFAFIKLLIILVFVSMVTLTLVGKSLHIPFMELVRTLFDVIAIKV
jgi:hypothetical protein